MFYIYAIYNRKYGKLYIGQTDDIERRLGLHNEKHFKHSYTSRFDGVWELIYKEPAETKSAALKREKELKSFRGRESIKKYIPW